MRNYSVTFVNNTRNVRDLETRGGYSHTLPIRVCTAQRGRDFEAPGSLRSCRYYVGARLKFWRRSRVPKKGSRDEVVGISRSFAARDGSAIKSHSTILQRLRRQISLNYYTIPPAMQAKLLV